MTKDLILRHCAAIRAQVDALEAYVQLEQLPPRATLSLPSRCLAYLPEDCARQSMEAVLDLGGLGNSPLSVMCRGCGVDPTDPTAP